MHKNFYKILFLFLIVISNLQASKQSENIKFQEQINNLKIEIAVLKSKQQFYDKQNDDKSRILSIEHDLKELEKELNGNKQDTKVFENAINMQDKRIEDLNLYLAIYGAFITILLLMSSWGSYKFSSRENKDILDKWIKEHKDEIINPIKEEARIWGNEVLKEQQEKLKEQNIEDKIDKKYEDLLEKVEDKLEHKAEENFTFDDWNSKGTNEYYNGSKEKALEYLNKAIELDASKLDISNSLYKMGVISAELKDNENAIKYYKMAIEKEDIDAMYNLALLYKNKLKDNDNAIKYYKMAIAKEHIDAMYNLANLYKNELQDAETANYYFVMHKKYTNEVESS